MPQTGEALNEVVFGNALERSKPDNFIVGQSDLARPTAAGGTTLTFEKNRHGI